MKQLFIAILFLLFLLPNKAANKDTIPNVIGTQDIIKVSKKSLRWLKTEVYMGMQIFGDTLIISSSVEPDISKADKQAGEENLIREKFKESRLVLVSRFQDRRRFKVEAYGGEANLEKYNGGLAIMANGKTGLLSVFDKLKNKAKLFYVDVDKDLVTRKGEWEGNIINNYVAFPTFSNKYRETVFMTKNDSYDLYLWDNAKNRVRAFAYNSDADEMYPTILNDSILFFASDRVTKGDFDIYYYNLNSNKEPELFLPDEIQTGRNELGVAFLNDTTFILASQTGSGLVSFDKISLNLVPKPKHEYEEEFVADLDPKDRETIQLREQGRIALTMFQERYDVSIPVRRQENIFRDSVGIDREIVRAVKKVLDRDNAVDVSFLLPVYITDTAYLNIGYDPEIYLIEGLRKISELVKRIPDSNVMAIGFADATGGSDLNLMRSYYQASSFQMQFTDFSGIDSLKIHTLACGDLIPNEVSIRRISEKEKRGAIYLFKNIKAPQHAVAYKLKPGETKEIIAARMGLSAFEFTYYNVLLTPFITQPKGIVYIPVKDLEMIWQGHDIRETAKKFKVPIKKLLKVNNLTDYINTEKRILYIPQ